MTTTLWLGMSTNSMIADSSGHEEFLSNTIWSEFVRQIKKTGCVIMGKNAYLNIQQNAPQYQFDTKGIKKIIITATPTFTPEPGWETASSPEKAISLLREAGFSDITVTGGSLTSTSFLRAHLIDEIIYAIEPVIKGEGIPTFSPINIEQKLKLMSIKNINGIVKLQYNLL